MKCRKPLVHRPEFEGMANCKTCDGERLLFMEEGDKIAKEKGFDISPTGMYVSIIRGNDGIIYDKLNICNVCIFVEDCPDNYEELRPTSYDGDCDECGLDSRFYVGV